jgi:hypothetical protein
MANQKESLRGKAGTQKKPQQQRQKWSAEVHGARLVRDARSSPDVMFNNISSLLEALLSLLFRHEDIGHCMFIRQVVPVPMLPSKVKKLAIGASRAASAFKIS